MRNTMETTRTTLFIVLALFVSQTVCLNIPVVDSTDFAEAEWDSNQQRYSSGDDDARTSLQTPIDATEYHDDASASSSISGPVIPFNFPDPGILHYDNVTYAFATNNRVDSPDSHIHVQVATKSSESDSSWTLHPHHDALPDTGPWAISPGVWAPDVVSLPSGPFVLYYAAIHHSHPDTHCIGAAVSPPSAPLGPYTPLSTPLACPTYLGGAIDPDGFFDPATSRRYVVYKVDGNNVGHGGLCRNTIPPLLPTPIMLQEVSVRDGVTALGAPVELLDRTNDDGPLIEAPSLYRTHEGIYFLFYSSNCFTTPGYDVKYATATSVKGPYTRADKPLLRSGEYPSSTTDDGESVTLSGPGGMDILFPSSLPSTATDDADDEESADILFHAILSESDMPDGYRVHRPSFSHAHHHDDDTVIPERPTGIIRGMYAARVRFSGRTAWVE